MQTKTFRPTCLIHTMHCRAYNSTGLHRHDPDLPYQHMRAHILHKQMKRWLQVFSSIKSPENVAQLAWIPLQAVIETSVSAGYKEHWKGTWTPTNLDTLPSSVLMWRHGEQVPEGRAISPVVEQPHRATPRPSSQHP